MSDIFVNGGDKYGGKKRKKRKKTEIQRGEGRAKRRSRAKAETTDQTSHSSPKLRKWKKSVGISDQNKIPIIAFGDALFATSLKGSKSGIARRCRKLLRGAERQGLLVFILIDEYNISQVGY